MYLLGDALQSPLVIAALVALLGTLATLLIGKLYVDGRLTRLGQVQLQKIKLDGDKQLEQLRSEIESTRAAAQASLDLTLVARVRAQTELEPFVLQVKAKALDGHIALHQFYASPTSAPLVHRQRLLYDIMAPQAMLESIQRRITALDLELSQELARLSLATAAFARLWNSLSQLSDLEPAERDGPGIHRIDDLDTGDVRDLLSALGETEDGTSMCLSQSEFVRRLSGRDDSLPVLVAPLLLLVSSEPWHTPGLQRLHSALAALLYWTAEGGALTSEAEKRCILSADSATSVNDARAALTHVRTLLPD